MICNQSLQKDRTQIYQKKCAKMRDKKAAKTLRRKKCEKACKDAPNLQKQPDIVSTDGV